MMINTAREIGRMTLNIWVRKETNRAAPLKIEMNPMVRAAEVLMVFNIENNNPVIS